MQSSRLLLLFAAVPGLVAAWGVLELTEPPGPGFDPDSLSYLGAGISLSRGEGLRVPSASWASADTTSPLVHFPPGFSLMIAGATALGATPMNAARIVEAASACVAIMAVVVAAVAAGGALAAIISVATLAVTPAIVAVHGSVLSEPLFLALLACFVAVLATERGNRPTRRMLILGGLAAAATLVRYAGASLIAVVALDAFIGARVAPGADASSRGRWRARFRDAVLASLLPAIALGGWALSRPRSTDAEHIRDVGVYLDGFGRTVAEGLRTTGRWLAPSVDAGLATTVVALAMVAAIVALVVRAARVAQRGNGGAREVRLMRAVELSALCYILVIGASRLVADPGIPFDDRLLAPLFLLASLAIAVVLASWLRAVAAGRRGALILSGGALASWIAGAAQVSIPIARDFRSDGADMASSEWRLSPLTAWAATSPAGTRLYTNWPAAIWRHTGRAAFELPTDLDSATVAAFRAKLGREHGVVLAFRVASPDAAAPDSLAAVAGLVEVNRWPDGTIWRSGTPADSIGGSMPRPPKIRK